MRKVLAALCAVALTFVIAPTATAADGDRLTYGVRPTDNEVGTARPNFSYLAKPGGTLRDSIDVVNLSDEPLTVGVYAADAFTPGQGLIDLLPNDGTSRDVGAWITVDVESVTVPANDSVTVPFTITVPADATPGDHTGGVVTSLLTQQGTIGVDHRIGTRVYIRVAGELSPRLALSDVDVSFGSGFNPFSGGAATVTYTVNNVGNVRLDARQSIELTGPFGVLGKSHAVADLGELLPGSSLTLTEKVEGVWALGQVKGTVSLDPFPSDPDSDVMVRSVSASSTAWFAFAKGHLVVGFVVIAAAIAAVWMRARRKTAVQAAIDQAVTEALEGARVKEETVD